MIRGLIRKLLKEFIDPRSIPFEHQAYFSPTVTWYLQPHAIERMEDDRNAEPVSMEEISDITKKATKKLIQIVSDKRNNFKPGPGFRFQVIDKNNFFLTIGCRVDSYDTLNHMDVNILTCYKTGGYLRLKGFVATYEQSQLVIEV